MMSSYASDAPPGAVEQTEAPARCLDDVRAEVVNGIAVVVSVHECTLLVLQTSV